MDKSYWKWNFSNNIDMREMFLDCAKMNDPNISKFTININTSVKMSGMFKGAAAFNQPLDTWDTQKVTDMSGMFMDAIVFNQDISDELSAFIYNCS